MDDVVVVVPARDEADNLPGCLSAIRAAAGHPALADRRVDVVVVLDSCRDGSAAAVAAAGVRQVSTNAGSAGGARRLGVTDALLRRAGGRLPLQRCWIATTDADSQVPPDWLAVHLSLAADGADLVRGTVVLARDEASADGQDDPGGHGVGDAWEAVLRSAWEADYQRREGHPHVHGANLGVRASWYEAVGGFAPVSVHEDALLARAVELAGGRVVATAAAPVASSARRRGRAPGGVAADLRELVERLGPPA